MICKHCGFNNTNDSVHCVKCGSLLNMVSPMNIQPQKQKKKGIKGLFENKLFLFGLLVFWIIIIACIFGGDSDKEVANTTEVSETEIETTETNVTEEVTPVVEEAVVEEEPIEEVEPEMTEEEFKASCVELNYKEIMRYPDEHIGENYYVEVEIFECINGTFFEGHDRYYKAFMKSEYGYNGDMIWVFDDRNEESEGYMRLLEDDIVVVYGTFEGLIETQNLINKNHSDNIGLDIKYADLIGE